MNKLKLRFSKSFLCRIILLSDLSVPFLSGIFAAKAEISLHPLYKQTNLAGFTKTAMVYIPTVNYVNFQINYKNKYAYDVDFQENAQLVISQLNLSN